MRFYKMIETPWQQQEHIVSNKFGIWLVNGEDSIYLLQNCWTLSLTMISCAKHSYTIFNVVRRKTSKVIPNICSVYADRYLTLTLCTPWFNRYTQSKEFSHCVLQFQLSLNLIAIIDSTLDLFWSHDYVR